MKGCEQTVASNATERVRRKPGKMGRASRRALDRVDLHHALQSIGSAVQGLDRVDSPERVLSRQDVEIELHDVYSHARLGLRLLLGVLRRGDHGFDVLLDPDPESDAEPVSGA